MQHSKSLKKRDKESSSLSSNKKRQSSDGSNSNSRENNSNEEPETISFDSEHEHLVFEDPFGDDFEEEEEEVDNEYDENEEEDDENLSQNEDENEVENMNTLQEENEHTEEIKQVWRPGIDRLEEGESLEYDPSAYVMYHSLRTEWPCLSFDFLKDNLGDDRQRFPMTAYLVAGSQADKADKNKITLLKLSELHKTQTSESDDDSEDDEALDEEPVLEHVNIPHNGGVNRIRGMPQMPGIVATMSENKTANIFDITATYQSMLNKGPLVPPPTRACFTFNGHRDEGFALDWSSVVPGRLATGDCSGAINVWSNNNSSWQVDGASYTGHRGSVEDIQWSPTEATVFASASADKSLKIWDIRGKAGPQINLDDAHSDDVNVISWNRNVGYLLASASDDGSFKVWDLRAFRKGVTLANFTYHKGPITSIEWAPHDESVLCVSSADDQVTIWDLSVEADDVPTDSAVSRDFPPQLLFIHQGQSNVKEIHHHPQIPGLIVSTAEDGLNVFKPAISVSS